MRSAQVHLAGSAHNVANLLTPSFQPLRSVQTSLASGGSVAVSQQEASPRPVDLADEFVTQMLASLQWNASLRAVEVGQEMQGQLVDLFA